MKFENVEERCRFQSPRDGWGNDLFFRREKRRFVLKGARRPLWDFATPCCRRRPWIAMFLVSSNFSGDTAGAGTGNYNLGSAIKVLYNNKRVAGERAGTIPAGPILESSRFATQSKRGSDRGSTTILRIHNVLNRLHSSVVEKLFPPQDALAKSYSASVLRAAFHATSAFGRSKRVLPANIRIWPLQEHSNSIPFGP